MTESSGANFNLHVPMERLKNVSNPEVAGQILGDWVLTLFSQPNYILRRQVRLPLYVISDLDEYLSNSEDALDLEGKNRQLLDTLYYQTGARINDRSERTYPDANGEASRHVLIVPVGQESRFTEYTFPGVVDEQHGTFLPAARAFFEFGQQFPPKIDS